MSVSDKPSKERLEQLAKTAALTGVNASAQQPPPGSGNTTTTAAAAAAVAKAPLTSAAEAPSGNKSRRFGTASGGIGSGSFGHKRKGGGGAGAAAAGGTIRRPIPLTRLVGPGGEPMNHVSALARSIQAAAGKKRLGGSTVAAVGLTGLMGPWSRWKDARIGAWFTMKAYIRSIYVPGIQQYIAHIGHIRIFVL